ncbi:hypothetical protein GH714_025065 [Hevea brasiliensis]|uniref:Uncharacterized protein n=1 Tax=Hevea brasiliensis TaxID=3981 RepID=A0A6A6MQU7_HEVBR|nr:hypothetical protein GH714_025065 [Hevea brasiliensis]
MAMRGIRKTKKGASRGHAKRKFGNDNESKSAGDAFAASDSDIKRMNAMNYSKQDDNSPFDVAKEAMATLELGKKLGLSFGGDEESLTNFFVKQIEEDLRLYAVEIWVKF